MLLEISSVIPKKQHEIFCLCLVLILHNKLLLVFLSGVYEMYSLNCSVSSGSSPHMWGSRPSGRIGQGFPRFIPTHVGFTVMWAGAALPMPVHPHTCGVYRPTSVRGLPPVRFIPTHVGFTAPTTPCSPPSTVHPHACGVYEVRKLNISEHLRFIPTYVGFTRVASPSAWIAVGSSPRVWGLHQR